MPAEPAFPAPPVLLAPPELGMLALLSEAARRRHAKEVEQAHQAHSEALEQWQQRKQATLDAYGVVCRNHRTAMAAWDAARVRHQAREQDKVDAFPARVRTDLATMHECLDDTLITLQWPRETALAYDIDMPKRTVMVDIDMPEVEHIPKRAARLSNDGRTVLMNELSDRAVRQAYARHVHGIAMRVCGVVFAALPSIRTCVVSGYSQRRDPGTGTERDDYLLSVRFERVGFSRIDFDGLDRVDPVCVAEGFALRRKMTNTGIFTPIQPFQPEEL